MNRNIRDNIKLKKDSPIQMTQEELEYANTPIGNAIINTKEEKIKKKWDDRVTCDICGKEYTRSAKTKHCRTKYHIAYSEMNDKIKKMLVNKYRQ